MVFAQNKRPFSDDESCPVASKKHLGQLDCHCHLPMPVTISACNNLPHKLSNSGIEVHRPLKYQDIEILSATKESKCLVDRDFKYNDPPDVFGISPKGVSGVIFSSSDASGFSSEETMEAESDSPTDEPFCDTPHCYSRELSTRFEEPLFPLDHYHRKPVALGPNHQAHVPPLELCASSLHWKGSHANVAIHHASPFPIPVIVSVDDEDDDRRMGSCIIPMPDVESDFGSVRTVGYGRINCTCPDQRSMRCVRQHIAEEREKLKSLLGPHTLIELGFGNMGEEVAYSWSIEEERLFQEVVYLNPVSLGKNFWNVLGMAFPSRSKKELVSYYFNVFVLRRRALQNRLEACNVADSDNDEWQGSAYEELVVSEGDDDSVVGSEEFEEERHPIDDYDFENSADDVEEDEGEENEGDDEQVMHEDVPEELDTYNKSFKPSVFIVRGSGPGHPLGRLDDQDVHNESCRAFHHNLTDTSVMPSPGTGLKVEMARDKFPSTGRAYENREPVSIFDDSFLAEHPCDSKVWDINFLPVSGKDVDILPTCSMIQEVFGDENLNKEAPEDVSSII